MTADFQQVRTDSVSDDDDDDDEAPMLVTIDEPTGEDCSDEPKDVPLVQLPPCPVTVLSGFLGSGTCIPDSLHDCLAYDVS